MSLPNYDAFADRFEDSERNGVSSTDLKESRADKDVSESFERKFSVVEQHERHMSYAKPKNFDRADVIKDLPSREYYEGFEAYEGGTSKENKMKYRLIKKKFKSKRKEEYGITIHIKENGVYLNRLDGNPWTSFKYTEISSIDHRRDVKDLMADKNFLAFRLKDSTTVVINSRDTVLIKNDVMKHVMASVGKVKRNYNPDSMLV
eukprot:CFRG7115T1